MGILQKADRCMDEAAALFGENKLFLAEKKAQETAGLYKSCGAYEQMAKTVNFMGVIYASIGDVSMSIDCYLEAMDVAVEQGSTEIIMLVNNNIGSLYMELGLYEKAVRYFNEALELCKPPLHGERDNYYQELLMLHLNLCISYTGINEFEKAEKHLSDAILFNEIAGSAKNRFLIDMSQAHMLWKMGNEDEVRDHVEELVEGAINNINSADYVLEILSLCNLFMNMGEFDAWKKVIVEYERFATETENLFFQKTCVKMWMKYESAIGDTIDLKLQLQETEYERRKAVRLNYTDMLTGMGNKFKMRNDFEKLVSENQDSGGAGITFGVVDIDFFKSFNRNSGRVTGDAVLKEVSSIINESIRDKGMGYHFYGDEFYIILQETDEDIIKNIAEHIRLELAKKQILHESSKVDEYLTVSQAYVIAPDVKVPDEFSRLFKTVDEVLNDVKEKGRNAYKIV